MAFEALNNAGAMNSNLIVILNDNDMSISPPVGAMSAYLSELISSRPYQSIRDLVREVPADSLPKLKRLQSAPRTWQEILLAGTACSVSWVFVILVQ